MNYYDEIKEALINNEITKRVKDYSMNRSDHTTYYNVGKMLHEAGKHYGDGVIKDYASRLTKELGKGYTETNLKYFRQFYLFSKSHPVGDELTWTHYRIMLHLKSSEEIEYYIKISIEQRLSKRELERRIKVNEYKRLPLEARRKMMNKEGTNLVELVKNPIIIKNDSKIEVVSERVLQKLILEDIEHFMKELGSSYSFIGSEYKIKIGDAYNYIDILLFNYEYNCFVVIELKVTELKKEHIGQIQVYMNYINNNLRKYNQDKTIGIIICKRNNKYVIEYSSDPRIIAREYELVY